MASSRLHPLSSLSPQLLLDLKEATDQRLENALRAISTSRYASSVPALEEFRLAIKDKNIQDTLSDFRELVPLTDHEAYRPWMNKFFERPCKLSEVENLFAPGLPSFLGASSSTTGGEPKHFARYLGSTGSSGPVACSVGSASLKGTSMIVYSLRYRNRVDITSDSGEVVKSIPACVVSSGVMRVSEAWSIETDSSRMASIVPGHAAPWATGFISHYRSFLLIHALFSLANPNLERIAMSILPFFIDMLSFIEEEWDTLLTGIRDGVVPDFDSVDHVREYLQIHMRADPQRADELRSIGPPLSFPAWVRRIWPNFYALVCVCGGPFVTMLPKARLVLGPDVLIENLGYGCTECLVGLPFNPEDLDTFVVNDTNVVEYLEVGNDNVHDNIQQAWELQRDKLYMPVVTTQEGLWRYVIDDILCVIGFDPRNGSPVFKFHGRKNLALRTTYSNISEADLMKLIQAINEEDIVRVQEFTTVLDQREVPDAVGCILEIIGDIGPNANVARQKAFEALVSTDDEHEGVFNAGRLRLPTIRILKSGTFAEYRQWRGDKLNMGVGQVKVPMVMMDSDSIEWLEKRVVKEL